MGGNLLGCVLNCKIKCDYNNTKVGSDMKIQEHKKREKKWSVLSQKQNLLNQLAWRRASNQKLQCGNEQIDKKYDRIKYTFVSLYKAF